MIKAVIIMMSLLGSFLHADEQPNPITGELARIMEFSHQQQQSCREEYSALSVEDIEDDLWMDTLKSDESVYKDVAGRASVLLTRLEKGETIRTATIQLQLLRNTLYAYADTKELENAGIKRRSKGIYQSSKEFLSNSSSLLIKTAGTIMAMKTIYDYTPIMIEYMFSKILIK